MRTQSHPAELDASERVAGASKSSPQLPAPIPSSPSPYRRDDISRNSGCLQLWAGAFLLRRSTTTSPCIGKKAVAAAIWDLEGAHDFSSADMPLDQGKLPFRVVKVIIPDKEDAGCDHLVFARSAAIGILTVFLAMVILYVIIRYVVVKPRSTCGT